MMNICCHSKFMCKEQPLFFVELSVMHHDIRHQDDDAPCAYGMTLKQRSYKKIVIQ